MGVAHTAAKKPLVSVIVPARNEEVCIANCLQSLMGQSGINFEVILVDDGSTDQTRKIAQSFPGVEVIDPGPLPPGWTGKNNAVWAGGQKASGEWLLFTDADTVHLPGSLAHSVAEAGRREAALLSFSPEQEVHGFWEKAVMPVIFAELAAVYRPSEVSDPHSPAAAANGQYLLIRRETYFAVGGHAAVSGTLLEDVALARRVKASGCPIFFRYGGDAVRTRMYRSFSQLQEGWTKNLALLFPSPARLAVLRFTEFTLILACLVVAVRAAVGGRFLPAALSGLLFVLLLLFLLKRIRKAHFSWDATALALAGLPLFSFLLIRSKLVRKRGGVSWKGRIYPSSEEKEGYPFRA